MIEFKNTDSFWDEVVDIFMTAYAGPDNSFRLAMSGGSAAKLLDVVQDRNFNWADTELWQVDERFVAPDDKDSNIRLLDEKIGDAPVTKKYFPILETRADSVEQYADMLELDEEGYLFDLCVLGIGPDGHTASLFPTSLALDSEDLVVMTETDSFAVKERMGLSFAAIEKSRHILVLMIGAGKKEIFETLQKPDIDYHDYPARKLLDMPQVEVLWLDN